MFKRKIPIKKSLYDKLKTASEIRGAASLDELVEKILEVEADKIIQKAGKGQASQQEIDEISNSLKGLGYLE